MKLTDQVTLFQALHDAVITSIKQIDQEVQILFELHDSSDVSLKLNFYKVNLKGCEKIKFSYWDDDETIDDVIEIANQHLCIVDAKKEGDGVLINCHAEEGGGYLFIKTKTIHVFDGKNIEIEFGDFLKQTG